MVPKMSDTERAALESGTIGFDRNIFRGNPKLKDLEKYTAKLPENEQKFLDNQVQELCEMMNDYEIVENKDLPLNVWKYIKDNGFLGMIIPKKYGGLEFTPHGHSQVVTKISTRSVSGAVSVSVPNSLGPAELLLRYGTEEQKDDFLPKLARGDHVPCFGLTGPTSGSDAANMVDTAIVEKRNGELGIVATFNKRYITLAPIATCIGIAVKVEDPEGLLHGEGKAGITVALLERNHTGLNMGKRHDPLSIAFMNGPVTGENVWIPMKHIIGGQKQVGSGWNMLMDCLAEGRSISLPGSAVAAAKLAVNAVGGYSRIRKQFKVPIATMEGVQEHLARIGGHAFITTSGQHLVNAMINQHEQPAVISGVCKQQITERGRAAVIEGMDVLGGAGICKGPNNFIANGYISMPVAITVEGANTLTRSLIIYGQGLTRAHPHLYDLIQTIQDGNDPKGFKKHVGKLVAHGFTNAFNSMYYAIGRSRSKSDLLVHYESQLAKLATNFALCADMSLAIGGKLKFAEMISGRYADVFSSLYLGYACLWYYKQNNSVENIDEIFDYSMTVLCFEAQQAFDGIFRNFSMPLVGPAMRALTFPTGFPYKAPKDKQIRRVSELVSTDSAVRNLLSESVFVSKDPKDRIALINATLRSAQDADAILATIRKEKRNATAEEDELIQRVEAARNDIIQVDSFDLLGNEATQGKDYVRPALQDYAVLPKK